MPRIKNWKKSSDEEYVYRPDTRITAIIWNNKEQFVDKRHSHWVGELRFGGVTVRQLFSGDESKIDARDTFVGWLKNNSTVDTTQLERAYQAEVRETDESELGEMPDNPCVNYETCGGTAPGPNNHICPDCLSQARYEESAYYGVAGYQ